MSDFWARKLGINAPAQPTAPAPQQSATVPQPWFAPQQVYQQPVQQFVPQEPVQQEPVQQEPVNDGTWGTIKGSLAKAQSAKINETCPNCGSGNVFRPTPNSMLQCYECGHNPRFEQTGGMGGLPSGDSGPATPARQLATAGANGASQFSPGTIVGRI